MAKSKSKKKKRPVAPAGPETAETFSESIAELWQQLSKNRLGVVGFGLSLLQLLAHASWLAFAAWLSETGRAQALQSNDWEMWLIAGLVITGALLTMVSLFLCLYAVLHGKPKVLAIIGLALSFFIGTLTTFILLLQASAPK